MYKQQLSESQAHSVFIFDDVRTDKQNVIRDYFSMYRHAGALMFYLCQS